MNPAQQQFFQQWQGYLQQVSGQVTEIIQEANGGCQQLLQTHPDDPMPMINALQALKIKVNEVKVKVQRDWAQQTASMGGDSGELREAGQQANDNTNRWIDEKWGRVEADWKNAAINAMWPRVQQLMAQPVGCTQCGAPITPRVRHMADTVTCAKCGGVNQTTPDPEVSMYYTMGPDIWAKASTLEQRLAADRQASVARGPAGADALKQWEKMERDYWTAYYAARAQLLPASAQEQQTDVQSKMKPILDELQTRGMAPGVPAGSAAGGQQANPQSNGDLLAPVEGITLEVYADIVSQQQALSQAELQQVLAQHGMDMAKYARVANGWGARMKQDYSVNVAFASAMAAAQQSRAAAGGFDPSKYTFEQYCEILGAQRAWTSQGKDVSAMLKQEFNLTVSDFSAISGFWMPKLGSDTSLAMKMSGLTNAAAQKYSAR